MFNINKAKTLNKQELWEKVEEFEIDAPAGCRCTPEIDDLLIEVKESNVSGKIYPEKIWIASREKTIQ